MRAPAKAFDPSPRASTATSILELDSRTNKHTVRASSTCCTESITVLHTRARCAAPTFAGNESPVDSWVLNMLAMT
jgi:hypothetical protein